MKKAPRARCLVRTRDRASDDTPHQSAGAWRSRIERAWYASCFILVAACFAGPAATAAERVSSRYGDVSAARRDEGTFVISLDARPVAEVFASEVSFYRVTPQGDAEYIIVDIWQPGLYCQHSYVMLALHAERKPRKSRVFGKCKEIIGASHVAGGVQVDLRPSVQADVSKAGLERYLFSNGKVTRQRVPNRALLNRKLGPGTVIENRIFTNS
jgi:hypothetical protein